MGISRLLASPDALQTSFFREGAFATQRVTGIVIGLPLNMDGTEGRQAARVRAFGERLREHLTLPIDFWDERLTTFEAQQRLRSRGVKASRRRALVDQVAAEVILRSYLDGRT